MVYCKNCKFYNSFRFSSVRNCNHPSNVVVVNRYYGKAKEFKSTPAILNNCNNCKLFVHKSIIKRIINGFRKK